MDDRSTEKKAVLIRKDGLIFTTILVDGKVKWIDCYDGDETTGVGTVYIGRVDNIVSNISAAFIEYLPGKLGYLDMRLLPPLHSGLKCGDEIMVQLQREAVKTKMPVLSTNVALNGTYVVLHRERTGSGIGISSKITDEAWKNRIKDAIREKYPNCNLILRTKAYETDFDAITKEIDELSQIMGHLEAISKTRSSKTVIYKPMDAYLSDLVAFGPGYFEKIVTDDFDIYNEIKKMQDRQILQAKLIEYRDETEHTISLDTLYGISTEISIATSKYVNLPSGANIVIEHTEAMTVIDVNSSKAIEANKNQRAEETYLKINKEAAAEIARQLHNRNISGMIMVDFIDLKSKDDQMELINYFKQQLKEDRISVRFVDLTKLGIAEVTRKRVRKPLYEMLKKK